MTSSPVEEIKSRLDIVELIQQYIKLQKAGINYRGICPFHSEKRPSFFVSPSRQIWRCFGCSVGGDIFKFVMMIEGIEFVDALRLLAQKAGVELKREDPKMITERHRLYDICELATKFFEKQLESTTGQAVKKYLLERGMTEESIKKWRLGYAPESWQGLSDFLVGQGYKREEAVKVGLAIAKGNNEYFDRFRSRIMFPVFDLNSRVIGFGGRIFALSPEALVKAEQVGNGAKYVNSPATMLYDKSSVLYGLDKAKMDIRKKDVCIIVEGYVDAIMVSQAGFQNVVAASGTALTLNQLKTLKRYSNNLLTAFDMDIAGNTATDKGIDLAQAYGFNVRVVTMPADLDPADVIQKDEKEWKRLAENSKSIIEYYFENAFARFNPETPEGKKDISKIILPKISIVPNRIEQAHWIQQLATRLSVKEEDIEIEMKKVLQKGTYSNGESNEGALTPEIRKTRKEMLEERIIFLILKDHSLLSLFNESNLSSLSAKIQETITYLTAYFKENKDLKNIQAGENSEFLNELAFRAEMEDEDIKPQEEIQICLDEIRLLDKKSALGDISKEIKKAETEKNDEKIDSLFQKFNELSK